MKPAAFQYVAARTPEEAVELLTTHGPDAKLLAGGQSLVPMMNFRLVRPAWLVDLNRVSALSGIATADSDLVAAGDGDLAIGSMTRQADVEASVLVAQAAPLLAETVPFIGHPAIRNRGTVGGSLAHADPAAELPVAMLALDASMKVRGRTGTREIAAADFFVSLLATAVAADELLVGVRLPRQAPRGGWAFMEFARRHGDFALVAVATVLRIEAGIVGDPVRIALGGVADRPMRAREAEAVLRGAHVSPDVLEAAAVRAAAEVDPPSDVHGSADYRRDLTRVFVRRALDRAVARASRAGT